MKSKDTLLTIKEKFKRLDQARTFETLSNLVITSWQSSHVYLESVRPLPDILLYKITEKEVIPHFSKNRNKQLLKLLGEYFNITILDRESTYVFIGTKVELSLLVWYINSFYKPYIKLTKSHIIKQKDKATEVRKLAREGHQVNPVIHTTSYINDKRNETLDALCRTLKLMLSNKNEYEIDKLKIQRVLVKIPLHWRSLIITKTKYI